MGVTAWVSRIGVPLLCPGHLGLRHHHHAEGCGWLGRARFMSPLCCYVAPYDGRHHWAEPRAIDVSAPPQSWEGARFSGVDTASAPHTLPQALVWAATWLLHLVSWGCGLSCSSRGTALAAPSLSSSPSCLPTHPTHPPSDALRVALSGMLVCWAEEPLLNYRCPTDYMGGLTLPWCWHHSVESVFYRKIICRDEKIPYHAIFHPVRILSPTFTPRSSEKLNNLFNITQTTQWSKCLY